MNVYTCYNCKEVPCISDMILIVHTQSSVHARGLIRFFKLVLLLFIDLDGLRGIRRCGHTHDLSCHFHQPNN